MQYRKHNFLHNFLTAAAVDQYEAWEIIANEINDLALDEFSNKKSIDYLTRSGVKVPLNVTFRELAILLFENMYVSQDQRQLLMSLIIDRHGDPYVDSKGGVYDQFTLPIERDPTVALEKLLTRADAELTKEQALDLLKKDLVNKQQMRNIKVPIMDRLRNAGPVKVAVIIVGTSLVIYGICKILK